MYSYRDRDRPGNPQRVGPMISADSVIWALRYTANPSSDYIKSVFLSYVDTKFARGKTKGEVHWKLEMLERELPQYADEFRAVRRQYGLSASRVLPPARADDSIRRTTTVANTTRRPATNNLSRANTANPTTTTTRPATVRPPPEDAEPPPPPYTRTDPQPEHTRILHERLAAEIETRDTSPIPVVAVTPAHTQSIASASSSPAARSSSLRPDSSSEEHRPATPQRVPSDEDLRQVWEESQFEEATRMSRAAEQEREDLETAMRLSLAETSARGQAAGRSEGGPSSSLGIMHPVIEEDAPPSRPLSSYVGSQNTGPGDHRRSVSDAGAGGRPALGGAVDDLGALIMSRGAQPNNRPATSSLLDDEEGMGDMPMLTPTKTGAILKSKNPFLSSTERVSLQESEQGESSQAQNPSTQSGMPTSPPVSTPPKADGEMAHMSPRQPTATSRRPSASPLWESPGSAHTSYSPPANQSVRTSKKPLPSPPGPGSMMHQQSPQSPRFEPPPGPPPSHLRVPSLGGAENTPPLPPRRETLQSPTLMSSTQMTSTSESFFYPQQGTHRNTPQPSPARNAPETEPEAVPPRLPMRKISTLLKGEDPLEMLKDYDTVFLIDDSASMAGDRWETVKSSIIGVAEIAAEYDEDGVDVYFLNSKRVGKELKANIDVEDLFAGLVPRGSTPTGARLEAILRDYMARLERFNTSLSPGNPTQSLDVQVKPMNLIVVTDGAPTDDPESVVVNIAKRLDRGDYPLSQVGIQFFQVGNDSEAREALQELDDGLAATHGVRDMVDTIPYQGQEMTAALIVKTLLGGMNRRLDRRS